MASVLRCLEKLNLTGYAFKTVPSHRMMDLMIKMSCTTHQRINSYEHSVVLPKPQSKLFQSFYKITQTYKKTRCTPAVDIIDAIQNLRYALEANFRNLQKNQTLLLLRCCGKPTIDILTSERKQLTQEILDLLSAYSFDRDILYYNTMLQVMLENDYDLSRTILEEMKIDNIQPNEQTYMILLEFYSKKGNVMEANNTVQIMKDLNYTLTPDVYRLLIAAYSESGDVAGAEQILNSLKDINIVPNGNIYTALMCGYAKTGDIENIRRILTQSGNTVFLNGNFLDIAYTLIFNNHMQYVDEVLSCVQMSTSLPIEEVEFIGKLLELKNFKTSMDMFISIIPSLILHEHMDLFLQSILCRLMSNAPQYPNIVLKIIDDIDKNCAIPFFIDHAILASFKQPDIKVTYKLFEYKMQKHEPIKPHYFWPLFVRLGQSYDVRGVFEVLTEMTQRFHVQPCIQTLKMFVISYVFERPSFCRHKFLHYQISPHLVDHAIVSNLLDRGKLPEALNYVKMFHETSYDYKILHRSVRKALHMSENCFHYFLMMNTFNRANINIGGKTDKDIYMTASYNRYLEDNLMQLLDEYEDIKRLLSKVIEFCWTCNTILTKPVIDRIQQIPNLSPHILDILDLMMKLPNMPDIIFSFLNNVASDESCAKYESSVIFEISDMNNEALMIDTLKLFKLRCVKLSLKSQQRALRFFCQVNNLAEAQKYTAVLSATNDFNHIHQTLVLSYVELLISHNAIDEADKFIKDLWKIHCYYSNVPREMKSKCNYILTKLISEGRVKEANQIFECFKMVNFVQGNSIQCPDLVKHYVKHGDIEMALKSLGAICDSSQQPPHKHKLTKLIIEKKQGSALQQLINECIKVQSKKQVVFELIMDLVSQNYPEKALDLYNTHASVLDESGSKYSTMTYLQEYNDNDLEALYRNSSHLPSKLQSEIYENVGSAYIQRGDQQKVLTLWNHIQAHRYPYSEPLKRNVEKVLKDINISSKNQSSQIEVDEKIRVLRT